MHCLIKETLLTGTRHFSDLSRHVCLTFDYVQAEQLLHNHE